MILPPYLDNNKYKTNVIGEWFSRQESKVTLDGRVISSNYRLHDQVITGPELQLVDAPGLQLNGSDQSANISNTISSVLDLAESITLSCYIKSNNVTQLQGIIGQSLFSTASQWGLAINSSNLQWYCRNNVDPNINVLVPIQNNILYKIEAKRITNGDGTVTMSLKINDVETSLTQTFAQEYTLGSPNLDFFRGSNFYFNGVIAGINISLSNSNGNFKVNYICNEGTGTILNDTSGGNNNITINNAILPDIWSTQNGFHYDTYNSWLNGLGYDGVSKVQFPDNILIPEFLRNKKLDLASLQTCGYLEFKGNNQFTLFNKDINDLTVARFFDPNHLDYKNTHYRRINIEKPRIIDYQYVNGASKLLDKIGRDNLSYGLDYKCGIITDENNKVNKLYYLPATQIDPNYIINQIDLTSDSNNSPTLINEGILFNAANSEALSSTGGAATLQQSSKLSFFFSVADWNGNTGSSQRIMQIGGSSANTRSHSIFITTGGVVGVQIQEGSSGGTEVTYFGNFASNKNYLIIVDYDINSIKVYDNQDNLITDVVPAVNTDQGRSIGNIKLGHFANSQYFNGVIKNLYCWINNVEQYKNEIFNTLGS